MLRRAVWATALLATTFVPAFGQTPEVEPNDDAAHATPIARGQRGTGTIEFGANTDEDYWVVTARAGETIFADVDANEFGSYIDPSLTLYAGDRTTVVAGNSEWDGLDPHITYVAPTSGSYYVRVSSGYGGGGPQPYTINFFEIKCPVAQDAEPNDTTTTAKTLTGSATIHGIACPAGDPDWYKFSATAGSKVTIQMDTVGRERPPFGCACGIYAWMILYASDGFTSLQQTTENDPRIVYQFTSTGTYYLRASVWPGGLRYPYTLHFDLQGAGGGANGPGDPPTVRAQGLGTTLMALIADPYGDFIVADQDGNRVVWATTNGRSQVITPDVPKPVALAWDVFANLLIVGANGVYRLNPQGKVSQFITRSGLSDVALAPDGTLWFSDSKAMALLHYDPLGHLIATINVAPPNQSGPNQIAIGPNGDVFYTATGAAGGTTLYNFSGQPLLTAPWRAADIAVDGNGDFYVTSGSDNAVLHYSKFGAPISSPLATGAHGPTGIAFGRNSDGSMNNRLFVVEFSSGRLVELKNSATPTAGAPVGFATTAQVVGDLLKPGALSEAQRHVLDVIGNKNGRYDVGDLRAFLINTSALTASHAH